MPSHSALWSSLNVFIMETVVGRHSIYICHFLCHLCCFSCFEHSSHIPANSDFAFGIEKGSSQLGDILWALGFKRHVTCLVAVPSLMTQDVLLLLNCFIGFCSILWVGGAFPTPKPQKPGPVVFRRDFTSLSHIFWLFRGATHLSLLSLGCRSIPRGYGDGEV